MFDRIWTFVLNPIWSIVVNCLYWIRYCGDFKATLKKRSKIKKDIYFLEHVKREMSKFKWKKDTFKDWTPWVITIIHKGLVDDCDGAAIYCKFLFDHIRLNGKVYSLRGKAGGHAVCVSDGGTYMGTNNQVLQLDIELPFKERVLKVFNGDYDRIL